MCVHRIRFYLACLAVLAAVFVWPEMALACWPVLFFLPGPSYPCCADCTIFSDDFSTDRTGTDYSVRSGTWSVSGGTLSTTSASALIRCETACDAGATGAHATVKMTFGSTSDKGRIILCYSDDSNYWFVEVQPGASNGTLKVYERSGGTNTQRGSTTTITGLTTFVSPTICFSIGDGFVNATTSLSGNHFVFSYASTPTMASTKSGMGTGTGSASVTFDDFEYNKHRVDDSNCSQCYSRCSGCSGNQPDRVQVVTNGAAAGACGACCDAHNGTFVLERAVGNLSCIGPSTAATCAWNNTSITGICESCAPTGTPCVTLYTLGSDMILYVGSHYFGSWANFSSWTYGGFAPGDCLFDNFELFPFSWTGCTLPTDNSFLTAL